MMFYLWPCLIKMTSLQETSKANNFKGMKNLILPEVSSRGRKKKKARESRQRTPKSRAQRLRMRPTSSGRTSFQETRMGTVPGRRWALFSLATSTHLDTLNQVQMGAADAHVSAVGRELGVLLCRRAAARTSQNHPRAILGRLAPQKPRGAASQGRLHPSSNPNTPSLSLSPIWGTHSRAAQALRWETTPTSENEILVVGTTQASRSPPFTEPP